LVKQGTVYKNYSLELPKARLFLDKSGNEVLAMILFFKPLGFRETFAELILEIKNDISHR
jgi:hypothetical protein